MTNIILTGSTGFIGQALAHHLHQQVYGVIAAVRRHSDTLLSSIRQVPVSDILPDTDWKNALTQANVVIHLAARAHITSDTAADPLAEFRLVNTAGTLNLARQAAAAGVRRFIFLSSIGVNGNRTSEVAFSAENIPNPVGLYAISKHEAEIGLRQLAQGTGLEIVIIRPPLVYGANAPGNFGRLLQIAAKGIPLPFGAVHNQRSLVALENLIDLITVCIGHPAAANQTFLVSDGEDLSTTELLQRLGAALGRPGRLLPVPASWLRKAASFLGKEDIAMQLLSSLQIDMRKTCELLNWSPPVSVDEALRKTAKAYLQAQ
ncbi:MAG: UDP-glucose 4-epimerase family protein [Candidatus Electronema sp. V4]|uniref:UDP-glucose 4-epimerase family protein n=1 Tax=Candidatus Electronema sp. V4 TaxID=3454756 RepID=UPI0040557592